MGWLFICGLLALSFAITFFLTPVYIKSALRKKILGRDVNKAGRPRVAEMGGLALFAGMLSSISLGILVMTFSDKNYALMTALLASLASIAVIALVGVFDDLFRLSWRTKFLLPVVAAFPLIAVKAGETAMSLPFFGNVNFGLFYNFLLVPIGVTGAANALNMSAGYNGVEAGIGAIISGTLLAIALASGATGAAIVLAACFGACLAFLKFNWFPAKLFPGDVGTLVIGAAVASAVIIGNLEKFGVILFVPAFYELGATLYYGLKKVKRRKACHNPIISKDGLLAPPEGAEKYSLFYFILSKKPLTEKNLVKVVLAAYLVFAGIALASYGLKI